WVGQQSLILESSDIEALSTLIGHLQTRLQMKSVQFIVSPELRKNSEDKLISDALSAFKARALLIQKNMSAKSYKLVNVSVNTTPAGYTPVMMTEMRTSSMMPSPAMKSGTTEIKVTVSGTIELID
ncbi:MAG: SIMPL domain-containing protein, partial [Gammaproteobacteria bacterium]|nr:SIMPL domain-containing protein [Gammaproteobacteria bacterium]